ncbi:ABC transporter substrate-binding protein [Corallococcus exiguus]|uniref:Tgt2/MlaC family protein n=1 Tax=Corallococcus TaxID=83461 RepID=UPI000EC720A9|nr:MULTISPECIES: ABC transporter substrate-binding protein [Corallococcus]NNB89500.1 ABC transporter substrate-binding protein [Corallococcus exiguus]NNB96075.1 ABC transporter substrate-binding protein [Corallococcus exiguus]NNC06101.1 ABC transporter substrate-binding protein [Corallococcus exiguus]NPC51327.1 ABC transporter substrate-binding protein [Corallococcus exiguus]RKH79853.1 ABC transporter substrate-binding protein [Corallococcus sp. AB032C]
MNAIARLRTLPFLVALAFAVPALAAPKASEAITKPVKTVVQSVRYEKDLKALENLGSDQQGLFLLGDEWTKATDAQRKEFTQLFQNLFAKIAFPKVRENFKNLDSITYDEPQVTGDKALVGSTIFINHPLKKQEMKLKYAVEKVSGGWKVVDVSVLGDSMLTGIRDDQVRPLFKEGGWDGLLGAMRAKNNELGSVKVK